MKNNDFNEKMGKFNTGELEEIILDYEKYIEVQIVDNNSILTKIVNDIFVGDNLVYAFKANIVSQYCYRKLLSLCRFWLDNDL